jgi:hypothetical protein
MFLFFGGNFIMMATHFISSIIIIISIITVVLVALVLLDSVYCGFAKNGRKVIHIR